jgi:cell division protein FtsL
MIIIAFYLIFFSKQEESIGKAKKMLIWVAIALAVMWLSRYIVSYFYDIYNTATWAI